MDGNLKHTSGVLAGIFAVAVVALVGYKIAIAPPPEPDVETLCRYIAKSVTNAQCTAAIAPEGFPVGNVVVVPEPLNPLVPLPVTRRGFAETCWLDPKNVSEIKELLTLLPASLTLPGFKADVHHKLNAGYELSLVEADNLTITAGPRSDDVQNISVVPRESQVFQLDQGKVETLLHRPEVRENCFSRLLGPHTRLVVSTIVANGLEYSVTSSNDDHFDLDAAVESGYVKASTGPQVKGGGKLVTVLSPKEPRVIGAIFADDLLIADLKKLVMKGNVLHASGKSQVNFSLRGTGILGNLVEVPVVQLPDGSIAFDQGRLTSFGDEFKSRLRQFGVVTGLQIDHPSAMGGTIARPTDSNPASGSAIASLDSDTTFVLRSGRYRGTAVSLQNGGFRTRNEVGGAEWSLTDNADGSFKVLKRLDGREVLLIRITRREGTNDIGESSIVIRVQDGDHHDIGTAFSRRLSEISSSGTTFESDLEHAGVYTVIVSRQVQARAINDASIRSQLRVEANLLPMHKSDLQ